MPTLEISLEKMLASGTDGCNNYSAQIKELSQSEITLGNAISTKKACINDNIAPAYYAALAKVAQYKVENKKLYLLDANGNELAMFIEK